MRWRGILLILAGLALGCADRASLPWQGDDDDDSATPTPTPSPVPESGQRARLTFNNQFAPEHSSVPVAVILTAANFDYGSTKPGGADLRFYDRDERTRIPHEIETWNAGGYSNIWIRVPQISGFSNEDYVWMYFDDPDALDDQNPAAVWEGFAAVWHLNGAPIEAMSVRDSTQHGIHGNPQGTMGGDNLVAGIAGAAIDFGAQDSINFGAPSQLNFNVDSFTVSMWVNLVTPNGDNPWYFGGDGIDPGYQIELGSVDWRVKISDGVERSADLGLAMDLAGQWSHIAFTVDRGTSTLRGASNGMIAESTSIAGMGPIVPIGDATLGGGPDPFTGTVDEVRIRDGSATNEMLVADYLLMSPLFTEVGPAEPVSTGN